MDYERAIKTLVEWAETDESVRALVMTGSGMTGQAHALSDRDIEIYTNDPTKLLDDESWWHQLGEVLVVERLPNPGWFPTRLVYYAGGKIDFVIAPADALASKVTDRPVNILVDKDGQGAAISQLPLSGQLPGSDDFDETLHWAYAAALMIAKAVVRDELWSAKNRDQDLKEYLLRIIEWDHRARYGTDYDTYYLGTRMQQWMDADIQHDLRFCWGHFDADDTARALIASVDLLARLATRTAERLGFTPFDHDRLRTEIEAILAMRG